MGALFKNPWTWLLIFFLMLVVGTGVFLFRGKSTRVVEQDMGTGGAKDVSLTLSKEDSANIVRKLEEGSVAPGESESKGDADEVSDTETPSVPGDTASPPPSNTKAPESKSQKETPASVPGGKLSIVNKLVSFGFANATAREIDTVVIHSTFNQIGGDPFSVSKIIDIYKSYGVAPHYLMARDGVVYRLVEEKNIAYHAGDAKMPDGRKNVNDFSIGIEVIGKDDGSPSDEQYASLKKLLSDIKGRNDIKHIVGHSDIAPGRKTDPWGFDWKRVGGKKL